MNNRFVFFKFWATVPEEKLSDVVYLLQDVGLVTKQHAANGFVLTFRVPGTRIHEILNRLEQIGLGIKFGYLDVIPLLFSMPAYFNARSKQIEEDYPEPKQEMIVGSPSNMGTVRLTKLFDAKPTLPNSLSKLWDDNLATNPNFVSWYEVPKEEKKPTVTENPPPSIHVAPASAPQLRHQRTQSDLLVDKLIAKLEVVAEKNSNQAEIELNAQLEEKMKTIDSARTSTIDLLGKVPADDLVSTPINPQSQLAKPATVETSSDTLSPPVARSDAATPSVPPTSPQVLSTHTPETATSDKAKLPQTTPIDIPTKSNEDPNDSRRLKSRTNSRLVEYETSELDSGTISRRKGSISARSTPSGMLSPNTAMPKRVITVYRGHEYRNVEVTPLTTTEEVVEVLRRKFGFGEKQHLFLAESKDTIVQKTKASFAREVVQRIIEPDEYPYDIAANWDLEPDFLIQTFVLKRENEIENDPVSRVFRHEVQKFIRSLTKQVTAENENKIKSIVQQLEDLFLVSFSADNPPVTTTSPQVIPSQSPTPVSATLSPSTNTISTTTSFEDTTNEPGKPPKNTL